MTQLFIIGDPGNEIKNEGEEEECENKYESKISR